MNILVNTICYDGLTLNHKPGLLLSCLTIKQTDMLFDQAGIKRLHHFSGLLQAIAADATRGHNMRCMVIERLGNG